MGDFWEAIAFLGDGRKTDFIMPRIASVKRISNLA
jgi:hypothetical protein